MFEKLKKTNVYNALDENLRRDIYLLFEPSTIYASNLKCIQIFELYSDKIEKNLHLEKK
jgi:hypothetical protein